MSGGGGADHRRAGRASNQRADGRLDDSQLDTRPGPRPVKATPTSRIHQSGICGGRRPKITRDKQAAGLRSFMT